MHLKKKEKSSEHCDIIKVHVPLVIQLNFPLFLMQFNSSRIHVWIESLVTPLHSNALQMYCTPPTTGHFCCMLIPSVLYQLTNKHLPVMSVWSHHRKTGCMSLSVCLSLCWLLPEHSGYRVLTSKCVLHF